MYARIGMLLRNRTKPADAGGGN